MTDGALRVVAISDTHGLHTQLELPPGDVLLHAGDYSTHGAPDEFFEFTAWFAAQPHRHKLMVAGNHDVVLEQNPEACLPQLPPSITYLRDRAVTVEGVTFYGAPWTPEFCRWAFMLDRGAPLRAVWSKIPRDTQVLITHGPPYGHGDLVPGYGTPPRAVGCLELLLAVARVRPAWHVFGHIHEGYGVSRSDELPTRFVNAALCEPDYESLRAPLVFEVAPRAS
ncbi:MAG: metallophosphatase domain-containing protein [Planctomycetes bacterium]|nr:metallophosphatase domain-containing protein [Planctomycetota bacterium]